MKAGFVNKSRWLALLGLLFALILCLGARCFCSVPQQNPLPEVLRAPVDWSGIVPGITSTDEALSILQTSPHVRLASIRSSEDVEYVGGQTVKFIQWDNLFLGLTPFPSTRHGNEIVVIGGMVRGVHICLKSPISAGQAVARFGEPEAVERKPTQDWDHSTHTAIYLLYPDQGLVLKTRGAYSVFDGLLTQNVSITDVYYFEPFSVDTLASEVGAYFNVGDPAYIEDWDGFDLPPSP